MILQCPACNARYAVPDHAIGMNGRTVRCAKCANEWFTPGLQATAENLEALLSVPEKPTSKPIPKDSNVPAPKTPARPSATLMSSLAAALVLAIVSTAFTQKPNWFGYRKTSEVVLADLSLAKQEVQGGLEYAVSGKLVNTSSATLAPPQVRITLVDKEGNPLQYWEPEMPPEITAKELLPFTFGPLATKFTRGDRLVVELGNPLELALRTKP